MADLVPAYVHDMIACHTTNDKPAMEHVLSSTLHTHQTNRERVPNSKFAEQHVLRVLTCILDGTKGQQVQSAEMWALTSFKKVTLINLGLRNGSACENVGPEFCRAYCL